MLSRRVAARTLIAAVSLTSVAGLTACSTVPSGGPSKNAVMDAGTIPDSRFLLQPISDFVIQKVQSYPGPSLYGKFGDYRGPVVQRVGVGDTLVITIFEAANGGLFSTPASGTGTQQTGSHSAQLPPQFVQRDGTITVPYAGNLKVAGKTIPEVEKYIVDKLTGKAIEPQVVAQLQNNISSSITITGEAIAGKRVPLSTRGDKLLDVIADAGGITAPAQETFLDLSRGSKTVRVPFQTLLNNPRENIYARPDDTLTLVRYPLSFTAVGATGKNAVVTFDAVGISLEEALGKSAGFVDSRSDPEGVFVFRYEPVSLVRGYPGLTPAQASLNLVPVVYFINMRDPKSLFLARRFPMHDKDVVFVSNSPFSDIEKVSATIRAVLGPTLQASALGRQLVTNTTNNANTAASTLSISNAPPPTTTP